MNSLADQRASISLSLHQPPQPHKSRQADSHYAGIVHILRSSRNRIRKAENHNRDDNVRTGNSIDSEPSPPHPEWTGPDALAARYQMGEDSEEVGEGSEDDEGTYKCIKCRAGSNLDGS